MRDTRSLHVLFEISKALHHQLTTECQMQSAHSLLRSYMT